jgi:periplasmic protein TonB
MRLAALPTTTGVVLLWLCASAALAQTPPPAPDPKLQAQIDAFLAAADPQKGPPIAAPVFKAPGQYAYLGMVGGYFPDRAARMEQNGYALIQCVSSQTGHLEGCKALATVPTDWGFDDASLRMAKAGYVSIAPDSTRPMGESVRVVIEFKKRDGRLGKR